MFKLQSFQLFLVLILPFSESYRKKCEKSGILYYQNLGCEAEKSDHCCDVNYKCPKYEIGNGTCLVAGKSYQYGESIRGTSNCMFCMCDENFGAGLGPCRIPTCMSPREENGCYLKRDLVTCCPQELYCPDESTFKCVVDEHVYTEHQLIYPKDTCWKCICNKGFKLFEEPFCRRTQCDMEVWNYAYLADNCTPYYTKRVDDDALCCPSGFICDSSVITIRKLSRGPPSPGINCKFREMKLSLHSTFIVDFTYVTVNRTASCECLAAPHPTCVIVSNP